MTLIKGSEPWAMDADEAALRRDLRRTAPAHRPMRADPPTRS